MDDPKLIEAWRQQAHDVRDGVNDFYNAEAVAEAAAAHTGFGCDWELTDDGSGIRWNGTEKFYRPIEWMNWLIRTHLAPRGHVVNGRLFAQGEAREDRWFLIVEDNRVRRTAAQIVPAE